MKEINKSNYTTFDDLWNESSLTEEEKQKIFKKIKNHKSRKRYKARKKKEGKKNDNAKN